MGSFSLRSLLLAAIVISNCITWTASRHSYTHNASGHRKRHRRNGAGLALSSDYVIPGEKGSDAGWGQWGPPSECSRSCGGGVKYETRICSTFGPDGQANCTGGATKYYSCNTQDCPDTSVDFRAEQCASYNDKIFKGRTYNWVPYTNGPRQCELNCMPKGERFYYRQAPKVVDGTRCNDESFDVCVNGECQPVGCDMMLGSKAREDKCRECRGNGSNCDTIAAIYDNQDLTQGYTDILLIPEGATNIVIEEIDKSNNYLALRSLEDNKYYLNGEYQISFPHTLQIAGALWHYERSVQGFAAPDKLRCLGPITEPLYLSLLTQETNVGIKYEYSIRKGLMPQTNAQYTWAQGEFTPCSVTCGTGFRTRNVTCHRREPFEQVEENLCDAALRPLANETCQLAECQPEWVPSPWSPCSKLCGEGTQSRTVQCQKIISNGYPSIVDENQCFLRLGDKPAEYQKCTTNGTCPTWFTGPWKPCDKLCGDGKQTRQVVCHRKTDGRVEVLVDESCEGDKPAMSQPCNIHPCDGIDWVVSNWTGCDSCLSKNYTREALCVTKDRQVVDKALCSYHRMPKVEKPCDEKTLPACQSQWYASQWSKCSVDCGVGVKTRKVFCGTFLDEQVEMVDDSKCDPETRYNDTTPCTVPAELCPAKWFTADWSECTKKCDGGMQFRKVMCLSGGKASNDCLRPPAAAMPDEDQPCNPEPCNIDELFPVSSTTVMDDDDLPLCEEEEDEVGAELTGTSPSDMMFSDAASISEGSGTSEAEFDLTGSTVTESEFTETGSGETELTFSTESSTTGSETGSDETTGSGSTEAGVSSTTGATDLTTGSEDVSGSTSVSTDSVTGSSVLEETTPSGATGETSPSAATGETSPSGATGETSPSGATGETSPSGATGETSPSGATGETSPSGATGETSPSGATGETSPSGATGETSPSGATGETSTSGATGETSPSGATGETSPSGATGETSPSGATGETSPSSATEETTTAGSSVSTDADTHSTSESTTASDETTPLSSSSTSDSTTDSSDVTVTSTVSGESTTTSAADTGSTTVEKDATKAGEPRLTRPPTSTTVDAGSSTLSSADGTGSSLTSDSSASTTAGGSSSSGSTVSGEASASTTPKGTDSSSSGSTPTSDVSGSTTTEAGASSSSPGSGSTSDISGSTTSEGSTTPSSGSSTSVDISASTTSEGATTSSPGSSTTGSGSTSSEGVTSTTDGGSTTEGSTSSDTGASGSTTEAGTGATSTGSEGTTPTEVTGGSETTTETGDGSSTTDGETTGSDETTPWDLSSILSTNKPRCRPRNKPAKCTKSKFGCCPDKRTAAGGPFDEGCPSPTTCKDTKYGCCPDGVSPAGGQHNEDCPMPKCEETLYGCCKSDNKTAAEGNDQEGCPPPCKVSKYGCCADNETQATGPNKAGCPESSTTTTESPTESTTDWESTTDTGSTESEPTETTTEGTTESTTVGVCSVINGTEVCQPCSEFPHGCCEDGKTAAHGPDHLGCCLLAPHGCCPDNYQAASGPDQEGCECKSARFGCCPDNISYATGANFTGCGCEHTPHGCCPDRHTEATGPNFEGCSCHTYQFGCCPDGETIAEGPNHQGCLCRDTTHGCCSDGVTAASGPDQEGCDCASSEFGCCPDGVTKAQSNNFTGCADAPVNRQAACSLPYDAGSCTNYTLRWYYDMQYGGCSRFHYGGCEGNGNRFVDKAECEDVCVRPAAKDVCQLPKVKGTCGNSVRRWYYDGNYRSCVQFIYGSCLGNANNFETRELCEKQCVPKLNQEEKCHQAPERGRCAGNFTRWGYDEASGECKKFLWGGCEGNSNRFISEAACKLQCNPPGEQRPECKLAQDVGTCTEMIPYWSFDRQKKRCVPIYYSGCGGNENRFSSQEQCEASCPESFEKDKCTLPASSGECRNYRERWFYDTKNQQCRMFPYGGCGGNANNFVSEAHCKAECARAATPPPAPPTRPTPPTQPAPAGSHATCLLPTEPGTCPGTELRWTYSAEFSECILFTYTGCGGNGNNFPTKESCEELCRPPRDICELPKDVGPCRAAHPRWYFDTTSRRCQQFYFGGCRGNANNFQSQNECHNLCELKQSTTTPLPETPEVTDICQLPPKVGPCRAAMPRWYFDAAAGRCARFSYGGCQGNGNNFPSARACEQSCAPPAPAPTLASVAPECRTTDISQCVGVGRVWYVHAGTGKCTAYDPARGAARCEVPGVFPSPEACERTCGDFKDLGDVCRFSMEPGSCDERQLKYYYDAASQTCQPFIYGGCFGGANRFSSVTECERVCMPDPCVLPRAAGNCSERIESWSYDESTDECGSFYYTGCNGNANRFESREECEGQCKTGVPPPPAPTAATRAPAPPQSQVSTDWCRLPVARGNCNQFLVNWYYDEARDSCERFVYTGCNGNDNRFDSKEDCEGLCKLGVEEPPTETTIVEEQCRLPSSLEPCGAEQIAFYYDYTKDSCLMAPIGGCTNIPNRYSTEEECLRSCGEFRGQDACHAPLDPGPCRTARQKYYWNLRAGSCEPFMYGGCGGGPNRFSSVSECERVCGHLAIDPACALPPAPGEACTRGAGGGTPRWHRSALYGDCRLFVYLGCGGNANNFLSKQECERHCSPPPGNATDENEVDCEPAMRECTELRCEFGLTRTKGPNDECDRCSCDPNPCADMQCAPGQRCHIVPYRTANEDTKYTSQCRSDCSAERARCESLECEYTVQRTRGPDNCERCECVRPEPNCQPFADECSALKCNYGPITRTIDRDGCERCTCIAHPCEGKRCPDGQRCVVTATRNATSGEPQYSGDCGTVNKPGSCPAEQPPSGSCHVECNDDADCRGVQKCCHSGCSQLCRAPAPDQRPIMALTPRAPQPDPATEHNVSSSEGGTATLRCLFHSNPPPQITWKRGEITIDGTQGRYKLTSDGALQIVSLYRDDSGVYICVAQNDLGTTQQEITLRVDGPVQLPAGIVEESPSDVVGEIAQPLRIRCLAYGFPQPDIRWFHGPDMVPYDSAEYEARGNVLLIRSLRIDTLGEYTCQVFNGVGQAVSRTVVVRAERRGAGGPDSPFWLARRAPPAPRTERPRAPVSQPIVEFPLVPREYTVNVNTEIRATQTALATGGRLELACDVDGHPEPKVHWTKDGQRLAESDRVYITPTRLSITQVTEEDAGEYGCEADNGYTSHRSAVQISVQKLYIPEQCKDNQYFATCTLIVRSHLCRHEYYSKFCCKTCVEAGELNPLELEFQADQSWTFKKK